MARDDVPLLSKVRLTSIRTEILMAAVAIITLLAIWLVPGQKEEAPPALPQLTGAPTAEVNKAAQPPAETGTAAPATETLVPEKDGDRARAIIAGMRRGGAEPNPAAVYADAQRLQGEGYREDAYLLYRFAANHGNAQAALALGSQADPAYHNATDSFLPAPEPEQAIKWYRLAAADGNAEAATRLQALQRHLQQAAAAGDAKAQRLLLQWQ